MGKREFLVYIYRHKMCTYKSIKVQKRNIYIYITNHLGCIHQGKKTICRKDKLPRYHSATGLQYGESHGRALIEKKLRQKSNEAPVPHTTILSFQKTTPQYRAVKKQRLKNYSLRPATSDTLPGNRVPLPGLL